MVIRFVHWIFGKDPVQFLQEALFDRIGGKPTDWRLLEVWRAKRLWAENSALVLLAPHLVAEVKAEYTAAIGDDPDPKLENEVSRLKKSLRAF